ncbi:MAG: InlB B-repeat-containing protein [Anaerovoracaceae bacterium]
MKKRLFSIVLSLCMVLTLCLVTGMLSTVTYAEPSGTELTKEYLDNNCKIIDGCYSLQTGNYYLGEDITVEGYIDIGAERAAANVVLDLNGRELKNQRGILLCIDYSSTLTLTDSSPTEAGKVIPEEGTYVGPNSRLHANGGTIEGKVTIYNGVIDNTDPSNVTVFHGEVFCLDIGTVEDSAKVTVTFDSDNGNTVQKEKVLRGQKVNEPTAPTKAGYEFAGWYNGDTKYDFTQNVTENITLKAKWEDNEAPLITDLENSKTYCDTVEFEVSDNEGVASVTANDAPLTPNANNKYALEKGKGTVTVLAKDKAGNETSVTVTVNNGHTWNSGACSVCDYICKHEDADKDHECDLCGESLSQQSSGTSDDSDKNNSSDNDSKTDAEDSAKTGDDTNLALWLALMLLAGAGITSTTIYARRKRTNE